MPVTSGQPFGLEETLAQLNAYEGDNVWQDIILGLDGYDEAGTDEIDTGASDRFATIWGEIIRWDAQARRWYHADA